MIGVQKSRDIPVLRILRSLTYEPLLFLPGPVTSHIRTPCQDALLAACSVSHRLRSSKPHSPSGPQQLVSGLVIPNKTGYFEFLIPGDHLAALPQTRQAHTHRHAG